MLNVIRALLSALICSSFFQAAFAQTVLTSTSITAGPATSGGTCAGTHTGYPLRICASGGSYALGANLVVSGINAVEIIGNNVTLDMAGFSIRGAAATCNTVFSAPYGNSCTGGGGADFGIYSLGSSAHVKNGSVTSVNGVCVYVAGDGSIVENVTARNCLGDGIDLFEGVGRNLTSDDNLLSGIVMQSGRLESSFASYNNSDGLELFSSQGQIVNSHASRNKNSGVNVSTGLVDTVMTSSNGTGITATNDAHVLNSISTSNTNAGVNFPAGSAGDVMNTASFGNGTFGFVLSSSTCYLNVTTSGNTSGSISGGVAFASGVCAH
jgi:hypothetical protein